MKNTVFLKPLEFNLDTLGEKWRQGEKILGSLRVKNHSEDSVTLPLLQLSLMSGNYKKVKAKDYSAFEAIIQNKLTENMKLLAQEEKSFSFDFHVPEDCRITDKDGSVYLVYFDQSSTSPIGNLELNIQPKMMMMQFLDILDNFLRFKIGAMKFSKGAVEVKCTPPNSKEYTQVDSLVLKMKEFEKTLSIEYVFTTKKIELVGGAMTTQKKLSSFEQVLTPKQFYIYGESVNQDGIVAAVNIILNDVKSKSLLNPNL